jgi:chemotaxis protein CheY-P-specific phosphatase CheC
MIDKYQMSVLDFFWKNSVNEALDALSKMIGKEVKSKNSVIKIGLIEKIPKLMNPKEITTTLVYTLMKDDVKWTVVFSSKLQHFLRLVAMLLKKDIDYYSALSKENEPTILELGDIINGYFISSLNKLLKTKLKYNKTILSINPYRAIEEFNMGDFYKKRIKVLLFKVDFKVKKEDIVGKIFLIREEKNIDEFLKTIC